jgi:hypothetical protein
LRSIKKEDDPSKKSPTIFVTYQIINIMACVELFSLCCEGKSDVAEAKCQTEVITLDNAFAIIKTCEYFWQTFLDSNSKTIFIDAYENNVKIAW